MRRNVMVSVSVLLLLGVSLLLLRQAGAPDFTLAELHWTTNANAPSPGSGESGADTLRAFGLSGSATCRTAEPPTHSPWLAVARADAKKYQLDALVFEWKIWQESGFNPDVHNSSAGAIGIAQFMPETAAGMGIDPRDPRQALDASARLDVGHLKQYASRARQLSDHYGGWSARYGYALALAAYNAGPGSLESAWYLAFSAAWPKSPWAWLARMASETQHYIPNIMNCSVK
ncbi:MAG TPA: lytic transglycosylase domain-containing protein [Ktedonobacterales bacterium]